MVIWRKEKKGRDLKIWPLKAFWGSLLYSIWKEKGKYFKNSTSNQIQSERSLFPQKYSLTRSYPHFFLLLSEKPGGGLMASPDTAESTPAAAEAGAATEEEAHPYAFHVSGPRNVISPNWRDLINSSW